MRACGRTCWRHLCPEVGDEIALRVVDPMTPRLSASLRRHAECLPQREAAVNVKVAQALANHLAGAQRKQLREVDAVAILLAEGFYRARYTPGPVWLLPLHTNLLGWPGGVRALIANWSLWRPDLIRPRYGRWPGREPAVQHFAAAVMQAGTSRRET